MALIYAVEGCDGVGKTHFIQHHSQVLSEEGHKVCLLSTPSKTLPKGTAVREVLKNKSLYQSLSPTQLRQMFVESIQEVAQQIITLHLQGVYTLFFLDRWWFSYLAYQFILEGKSIPQIEEMVNEALVDIFLPLGISTYTINQFERNLLFPKVFHFDCPTDPDTLNKFFTKRMQMCQQEGSRDVHDTNNEFQLRVLMNYKHLFNALTSPPYSLDYNPLPIPILEEGVIPNGNTL